jgi:transcriptional regulator with XRE-family HTH domain
MGINVRLREERERLGYSQEAFGVLGGVRKQAQHMYESGARRPDANYLQALAEAGADVLYILTGQRSQAVAEVDLLPPRQRALLDHYEALSDEGKRNVEGTVSLLAKQTGKKKSA